ncbi:outer membrane protein [Lasallia pustulata]|uniref:Outer membrane protein n=1 Tax=Lasallia pustulata TaxID=136370 RepID=A0A1W5DCF1_9LECA|nr:outer membrane protein [Lasallia pustulata]
MAAPLDDEDNIFENLRKRVDPKIEKEKARAANEREHAQYEKAQQRLSQLVESNSTLPCTISSIRVLNANHTRKSFLERIISPILSANQDRPYTLTEALREASLAAEKLHKFDIFHQPISLLVDKPSSTDPSTTPTDIDIYLSVKEKSRILLKTGTDVGNAEGSAYGNLLWRNLFGGAETLNLNASTGTRTRSAYQANFETPILSNPDLRWEIGGLASSTQKSWASHEEVLKGGWTKLRWVATGGNTHEVGYNGVWRQVTGLASHASPTIRGDAGDSVKSNLTHTWISDRRDNPLLPSRGYYAKTISEIAGWGPLQGDVAFGKFEVETQGAVPIPIPGVQGDSGVSFTTGFRAGVLYPLSLGAEAHPHPSRVNDRFQLGGPTDVRGFRLSGLGPRDGPDAVGGDVYAAGSANLLFPLPRVGAARPFRIQAFVNGGRLLALKHSEKEKAVDGEQVRRSLSSTVAELGNGLPSLAAGFGLVYAHPVARFELNFSLPLVLRKGEEGRKGLSFGIGINLL